MRAEVLRSIHSKAITMGALRVAYRQPDKYDEAWKTLRSLRGACIWWVICFLSILPAVAMIATVERTFGRGLVVGLLSFAAVAFAIFSWIMLMVSWFRLARWRCPRCGGNFYYTWTSTALSTGDRCGHCGLHAFEASAVVRIDLDSK